MHISLIGDPIHGDFFSVVGTGIVSDAVLEFKTALGVATTVTPTFVRPHLAFVHRFPASVPVGPSMLQLTSPSAPGSNRVSVTVASGPLQTVRLLAPGDSKQQPYTIAFVANPGIEDATAATFSPDPILTNRPGYHEVVLVSFRHLFGMTEDLLRQGNMDARMRIISVFDPKHEANDATSLVHELPASTTMETRRLKLAPLLAGYGIVADIVLVIHGSTTHTGASAWYASDDNSLASTAYTYDGAARQHGHFPLVPGSAAINVAVDPTGLTIIHEFGHGASDFLNGKVVDLYHDGAHGGGLYVNKKYRRRAGDPVPGDFADYDGTVFASDAARDGLGYGPFRSYHADPIDATRPNLMDNYWLTADPQQCRFDQLTYQWFTDRLNAKLSR